MAVNLELLRQDAGLATQEAAARRFEVSVSAWRNWEKGRNSPPLAVVEVLQRMARGEADGAVRVPILGSAPAGDLDIAHEEVDDYVEFIPRRSTDVLFAVRARGESMVSKQIPDNSVVICRQADDANSGDAVLARVEGKVTIKTLRHKGQQRYLEGDQGPIQLPPGTRIDILGVILRAVTDFGPA